MQKSISQCCSSLGAGTRSYAFSSRQKFENVDKLQGIVSQIQQSSSKNALPEQVLDLLRHKIKNNYDNLYQNYDANKNQILRSIQQAQNTNLQENPMKNKLESVIRQKNNYDKLKTEVEGKQKKLKKMIDLKNQLKKTKSGNDVLCETLSDRVMIINFLEKHKQALEYQAAVLKNMEKQRKQIKLIIKQKHDDMRKNQLMKKQRIQKIIDGNHTKQIVLKGIEDKIHQEDICELPESLVQELQKKLQHFETQYAQENIISHEKILSQAKIESDRSATQKEKEVLRTFRETKQKEFNRNFAIAKNHLLLKQIDEQKIKKICGVEDITDLAGDSLQQQKNNLLYIRSQLEQQINQIKEETEKMRQDTIHLMTNLQNISKKSNLLELQRELDNQQTQLRRIKLHIQKKQSMKNEWEYILQLIGNLGIRQSETDCDPLTLITKIREKVIPKIQLLASKQNFIEQPLDLENEKKKNSRRIKVNHSQWSQEYSHC